MVSKHKLEKANFVRRGEESPKGETRFTYCGQFPCDHSKIVRNEHIGQEIRYCNVLQMPVCTYDSCKYHCTQQLDDLIAKFAETQLIIEGHRKPSGTAKKQGNGKNHIKIALIVILIALFIYKLL